MRPNILELELNLPPQSITRLSIEFERSYLKITDHHPGADHGFDIGSGVVTTKEGRIYTDALLVRLPTPDFSMPYNVITLSCTVMALFFGGVFNLLIRSPQPILKKE